jgi:hypothetical protein
MQNRLNLKKSIKKEIPTTATIYGKNVEDPIMLDQSHAFFGRGGELLAVIKRTPSTRQPSRALNGFGKGWATSTSGLLARLTQRRWVVAFILL